VFPLQHLEEVDTMMSTRRSVSRAFRPRLESLEDRTLLACVAQLELGELEIQCSKGRNVIIINDDGNGGITGTAAGRALNFAGVTAVEIEGLGKETVTYTLLGNLNTPREIDIEVGAGSDVVNLVFGGGGATRTINALLEIDVEDGAGNDQVTATFDLIIAELGGTVDVADVEIDIGRDRNAGVSTGKDIFNVNIALRDGSAGDLDVRLRGGPKDDTISLLLTGAPGNLASLDLDGGLNNDRCVSSGPPINVLNCEL
jgi:hypothetical protein